MKHLLIIGARGWGREVYYGATLTQAYRNGEYDVKGFLDSKTDAFEGLKGEYPPIICAPEDYKIQPDDVFFVAMGDPKWRRYYAEMFEQRGATFITIIENDVFVNPTASIGHGTYIAKWTSVSDNVKIGNHVMVHSYIAFGHDVVVEDYVSIEFACFLGGYSKVGEESVMHVRSQLIPHKIIGRQVSVGANSVVMRNVPDGQHILGNPAKKIEF